MTDINKKISAALRNSALWHQKEPSWVAGPSTYDFPETTYKVGKIDQIWYYSDKWEADEDWHTYYHDFDSHPGVYCSPESFLWKHVKRAGVAKKGKTLLGVPSVHGKIPLTYLADTLEMTIDFGTHKKRFKFQKKIPPLSLSRDRKTLIVLCDDSPIFIRGGQMIATARGIVK